MWFLLASLSFHGFCVNRYGIIQFSYVFLILLCLYFPAMPRPPEQPPRTEVPRFPFLLASRFDSRETSQAPYDTIQTIVREQDVDFSVFQIGRASCRERV